MLGTIGTIALIVAFAIAAFLVYAAMQPDRFQVSRTATIDAPPERIYPLLNDFKEWGVWSPYETKDPDMQRTFGATTAGTGATYGWNGDKNVGSGRMTMLENVPSSRVRLRLEMLTPMKADNQVTFTLAPMGPNATAVTWTMDGDCPFLGKVMGLIFNMDKMVGGDFEKGLANLKAAVRT